MHTSTDVFAKVRDHDRSELLAAARAADVLPYFHVLTSPAMPVVEMEGAERIMLGSNNYLGLTGDERVMQGAEDALHRFGTGLTGSRLLNGTIPLHLSWSARSPSGWTARTRSSSQPATRPTSARSARCSGPQDTVIADSGDHASILDGCLLSRAKLRPFRHNRLDKLEKMLQRAQDDGGGILVVVDGVFSMEGDIAPLGEICDLCERYGARLMVDEAHGAGVLGRHGAGTAELLGVADRVDLRMGTFSKSLASCGGFVAGSHEVIEYLRLYSRAFLFTASAVPAAVGAAAAALRVLRSDDGPPLLARVLENARVLRDGLEQRGFAVVSPQRLALDTGAQRDAPGLVLGDGAGTSADAAQATIVTPIVPVLVGDDWKAAVLWRALYDAGVFVNTALHPAVPPGGALLRTSVMATHDQDTLQRALDVFAAVKVDFESEHGPLPEPGEHSSGHSSPTA